jgi:hypothetical protein
MKSYTIAADGKSITCHRCGKTSYHIEDVRHRYCDFCHIFHDDNEFIQMKATMLSFRDNFFPFIMKWIKCCMLAGVDWKLVQRSLAVEALVIASAAHMESGGTVASFIEMANTAIENAQKKNPRVH